MAIEDLAGAWIEKLRFRDEAGVETRDYYRRGIETLVVPTPGEVRVSELWPVAIR